MSNRADNWPGTDPVLVDISSDDQTFDPPLRGISIGTAGTLKIDGLSAEGITIPAACLAIGIQHAICIKKIYRVGTSADDMVGWL